MGKTTRKGATPTYGEAALRLEGILRKIEDGEVDIDALSGLVQEAAGLVSLCREKIHAAEVQVRTITEQIEREVGSGAEEEEDGSS